MIQKVFSRVGFNKVFQQYEIPKNTSKRRFDKYKSTQNKEKVIENNWVGLNRSLPKIKKKI